MPAPAVYVVAAIGAIAAGIAFKQFIYEPHLAPKLEQWAEEFIATRRARRQAQQGYGLISVPAHSDDDEEYPQTPDRPRSNEFSDQQNRPEHGYTVSRDSIELDNLRQWRAEVDSLSGRQLRHRSNARRSASQCSSQESEANAARSPPTHILIDPSVPSTPSTFPSNKASPVVRTYPIASSEQTIKRESNSPHPLVASRNLPTPEPSVATSPSPRHTSLSPARVPSLSEAYHVELDAERGIELLSAPSSRAETPFLSVSNPSRGQDNQDALNVSTFSSPMARPAELQAFGSPALTHPLSELDFLSDMEDHNMMSPCSVITDATWDDDASSSNGSDSSWASAGPRGQ